ncbi:MAG: type IX secretion system outer membrane channel protein PorV [Cyclobacteriaceae bacterium]
MFRSIKALLFTVVCLLTTVSAIAQSITSPSGIIGASGERVITTGVPFLSITPDARSGGMGDAGVAISPDANATYWNPAKLAFLETELGVAGSFTPWLAKVVNDMSISYLSGYKKLNEDQALALSMTYFDLGDIQLTDNQGNLLNLVSPREFSLAATYSLKFSQNFSGGLNLKFIHSNLFAGTTSGSGAGDGRPGISAGADVSVFYTKDAVIGGKESNFSLGAVISNIGPKISYLDEDQADFLPTNLRLGGAYTTSLDPFNTLTFALDVNKLMVPTPDTTRNLGDIGLLSGMFGSFADAPDGFSEELREFTISAGLEYWYNNLFAVRGGYYYEAQDKGDRRYFTAGIGLRYQVFGVDFAYLVPQGVRNDLGIASNPLAETLRVTIQFNLDQDLEEVPER